MEIFSLINMLAEFLILIMAIPSGYLIAWLARDELISGRIWFKSLIVISLIVGIVFYFYDRIYISWNSAFVLIVSLIGLMRSYDETWTRER